MDLISYLAREPLEVVELVAKVATAPPPPDQILLKTQTNKLPNVKEKDTEITGIEEYTEEADAEPLGYLPSNYFDLEVLSDYILFLALFIRICRILLFLGRISEARTGGYQQLTRQDRGFVVQACRVPRPNLQVHGLFGGHVRTLPNDQSASPHGRESISQ